MNHEIHEAHEKKGATRRPESPAPWISFVCFVYFVVAKKSFGDTRVDRHWPSNARRSGSETSRVGDRRSAGIR
jgi:hypothetical protein